MRYTHHRGLPAVTGWVRLKYAAVNLKTLANWSWNNSFCIIVFNIFARAELEPLLSLNKTGGL